MAQILPRDLPPVPGGVLNPNAAIVGDDGTGVYRPTPQQIADAGAPINSKSDAEAGIVNTGRMTPLRVKQAIDALGVSQDVLASSSGGAMVGTENSRAVTGPAILTATDALSTTTPNADFWDGPDTDRLTNMIADLGYVRMRDRAHTLEDSLSIPSGATGRQLWAGQGMESSRIQCVGMTGKPAIKLASTSGLYRITMRDFRIYGDCDTALDLSGLTTGNDQIYGSSFENLWLESAAGSCVKADNNFSCDYTNVHVSSTGGHGFELKGDIVRTLTNCYAHNVGSGKAGYRIWGQANLIGCNGLDSKSTNDIWGDFGARAGTDAQDSQYVINLIGCNIEDFNTIGIQLRYIGSLITMGCNWVGKASTAVTALVSGASYQEAGWTWVDRGGRWLPKGGSSVTNNYRLQSKADARLLDVGNSLIGSGHWRNTAAGVSYDPPNITTNLPASNTPATRYDSLDYKRSYGFDLQVPVLWTANATTFAVTRIENVRTANTGATSFATATGGELGQKLNIIVQDANTTITHGTGANNFTTTSGANITAANGGVYTFIFNGTRWMQV